MSIREMQEYTRISKYALYLPDEFRRETWPEQIDRVMTMHRGHLATMDTVKNLNEDDARELESYLELAETAMLKKRVLGSQRVLQFGGNPVLKHNFRGYNCCASYADRPRFFQEAMYALLCGAGVGFSVQFHHVAKLPKLVDALTAESIFVIPDTIEGWSDAIGVLISSYMSTDAPFPDFSSTRVVFDYSSIRPAGSPLSSGAKAPGPDGLARSIEKMRAILDQAFGRQLEPIEVYDLIMHASDAVISGGVRRSATICIFSPTDMKMMAAKTGDWFVSNPQRGRSNNSVLLLRDSVQLLDFMRIIESIKEYGEPAFVLANSTEELFNPCVEANLWAKHWLTGLSGWSCCNLCEINGAWTTTVERFFEACKAAAILGTIQASYTSFPYLGITTEEIVRREALLGVGITGIQENPQVLLDPATLEAGAAIVKAINKRVAELIGIRPSARTTVVKPSGTTSTLLGTSSGIHPHHARRYFRRIQANKQENTLQYFQTINPQAVEDSVWDPNHVTKVVTFLCEVPRGSRLKNQLSALQLLADVRTLQQHWVVPGTVRENCVSPHGNHNVSNTINVKPEEWDEVAQHIYDNREYYAGVSLLPASGDKDYPQAPFCTVPTPDEILSLYGPGSYWASGLIESALANWNNDLWAACAELLLDPKPNLSAMDKSVWKTKAIAYAGKYFQGDVRQMTYCLKDVYNLKHWEDLQRTYQPVDWSQMMEFSDEINHAGELSCQGGACEMPADYLEAMKKEQSNNGN